jgi:hypothetical protein
MLQNKEGRGGKGLIQVDNDGNGAMDDDINDDCDGGTGDIDDDDPMGNNDNNNNATDNGVDNDGKGVMGNKVNDDGNGTTDDEGRVKWMRGGGINAATSCYILEEIEWTGIIEVGHPLVCGWSG